MASNAFKLHSVIALAAAAALGLGSAAPASADKPSWAGNGNGNGKSHKADKADKSDKGKGSKYAKDDDRHDWQGKHGKHFGDHDRDVVRRYYGEEFRKGKGCPPGLAKKHNGCMPPGLAKKWRYGHALPRDVTWYPLPKELIIKLPAPPVDYRYVRVASDILLIAVGTNMVVDAITDLGQI